MLGDMIAKKKKIETFWKLSTFIKGKENLCYSKFSSNVFL